MHHFNRLMSVLAAGGVLAGMAGIEGCKKVGRLQSRGESHAQLMIFSDHSGSVDNLRKENVDYVTLAVMSAPPRTHVEACMFSSTVKIDPFYIGTVPKPAAFRKALAHELQKPSRGEGTFGAPILRRVRERLQMSGQPTQVAIFSDGGFNDLSETHAAAELLAKEPNLVGLYVLPVTSDNNAYTKLEAALRPIGSRVRLASSADAHVALQELQKSMRRYATEKGNK